MEWNFRGYTVSFQVNGPALFHQTKAADYSIGYYATFSSVAEGTVTSQMILIDPLTSSDNGNDVTFRTRSLLVASADTPSFVKTLNVKTCSAPENSNVADSNFGEQAEFRCDDGYVLKYKDTGMDVEDPATECSASGEFTGSDNVECVPIEEKPVDDNTTEEDDKNKVIIISCSCVGGALIIFFILYCACCRNKDKVEPDDDLESNSSVSTKKSSKNKETEKIEMKTKEKNKRKESAAYDNSVQF